MQSLANIAKKPPSWSKEFDTLIRAIGECKSKAEEDAIITREVEILKPRLKDPKLDKRLMKELMVRLIYVEMLGHDASWAHVRALQSCSDNNLLTKKVAYLASTLFLDHKADTIILLVNTLQSDLKSDNYLIVCTALSTVCKLISADLINAVLPTVVELINHPKELVRKKAVMALHRFQQLDPNHDGPLHGIDLDRHFRQVLCDKDPSVMGAALNALHELIKKDSKPYRNLIPSFVSILKQVAEHRLPKTFDYHRTPAPFLQIKLLQVLAILGAGDKAASENMYAVIADAMRRANTGHTIGNAVVFECVRTITMIYPNPPLLQSAAEMIASFLKSGSHNLKYIGIESLSRIVRINPKYATEHQVAVIDCLEDQDVTLKKKTLELLYKMTKPDNVEVIVEKMIEYLRSSTDEVAKLDVCQRISELAESYAPDTTWFINTMNKVFELGGDVVQPQLAHNLMRLIAEGSGDDDEQADAGLRGQAVESYLTLLDKPKLAQILLKLISWVLGEYGTMADCGTEAVLDKLCAIPTYQKVTDDTKGIIITAVGKLCAHAGIGLSSEAEELIFAAANSRNVDLQQRALEVKALLSASPAVRAAALPEDASCEDIEVDPNMPFLTAYVQQALRNGAAPYIPEDDRISMGAVRQSAVDGTSGHSASAPLRFTAYETAKPPNAAQSAYASDTYLTPYDVTTVIPSHGMNGDFGPFGEIVSAAAVAASSAPAAAPAASSSQVIKIQGAAKKWGPARFDATPAAAAATSYSSVSPQSSSSIPTVTSTGPPPPVANHMEQQPFVDEGKQRLQQSLFGGGSTGSSSRHSIKSRGAGVKSVSKPAAAAPTTNHNAAPKASDLDLLLDLSMETSQPAPISNQSSGLDPFAQLEGLDLSSSEPVPPPTTNSFTSTPNKPIIDLDALMGPAPPTVPITASATPGMVPAPRMPQMPAGMGAFMPPIATAGQVPGMAPMSHPMMMGTGYGMPGAPAGPGMLPPGMMMGPGGMQKLMPMAGVGPTGGASPTKAAIKKEPDPFADLWK